VEPADRDAEIIESARYNPRVMTPIIRASALSFLRRGIWLVALVFPAALALWSGRSDAGNGAAVLLACLHYLLPALASIFLITSADESGLDLLLSRPLRWPRILLGRWTGAVAVFGACHALLALGLFASLLGRDGLGAAPGRPAGRILRPPAARLVGPPGATRSAEKLLGPWPSPVDPVWLAEVGKAEPWTFEFTGLPPGQPVSVRVRPLMARILTEAIPGGETRHEIARSISMEVDASFRRSDGSWQSCRRLELVDEAARELELPPEAVLNGGNLALLFSPVADEGGTTGGTTWGSSFFWFDPPSDGDPLEARDCRVVAGSVSYAGNVLRASCIALGGLFLMAALATAAAALFSPGVALGFTLVAFVGGNTISFLTEVKGILATESAAVLLERSGEDHHDHAADRGTEEGRPRGPGAFEKGLKVYLEVFIALLPDLGRFRAGEWLAAGEAVPSRWIAKGLAESFVKAAAVWLGAILFLFLWKREWRR